MGNLKVDKSSLHVQVDVDLLRELVNASARTALSHRNDVHEQYVLGQLEATANLVYIISAGSGNDELESMCQKFAYDALQRLEEINPSITSDADLQDDYIA